MSPVIGKKEKDTEVVVKIPKRLIHESRLVEPEYNREVIESVKKVGVKQPLLIRPCVCNLMLTPHFEIVNGHSRFNGIEGLDVEVPCIIRNLTNLEVLQLMHHLEYKGKKTVFWRAENVAKHLQIVVQRLGNEEGAKTETAKKLDISLSQLSQYLRIDNLRIEVQKKDLKLFESLKSLNWGINRLYQLTRLLDYPTKQIQGVNNALKNPRMRIDEVKKMVDWLINPPSDHEEKKQKQAPTPTPKPPIIELKPDTLPIDVPSDLKSKIEEIVRWVCDEVKAQLDETVKRHFWVRKRKILRRFRLKEKKTMKDIALDCLKMGIEDVFYGRKVYPIVLRFESLGEVPIGFKGIFKERSRGEKLKRGRLKRQYRGLDEQKIEELIKKDFQRYQSDPTYETKRWSIGSMENQRPIEDFQPKEEKLPEIKLVEDKEKD